jgi:ATP-binding cassette subfamily C protein
LSVAAAGLESAGLAALPVVLKVGGGSRSLVPVALTALPLPALLGAYVLLAAMVATLNYARAMAATRLVIDYGEDTRTKLHRAVMAASLGAPALSRGADLVHALTAETGQCSYAVQIALNIVTRVLYLPPLLASAVLLSPVLTVAAIALTALAALPMIPVHRRTHGIADATVRAARELNAEISDEIAGLRILKILRAEAERGRQFRRCVADAREAQLALARANALVLGGQRVALAVAVAGGGYYGLTALHMDSPALIALAFVFARLTICLGAAQESWRQLARLLPAHRQLVARLEDCRREAEPEAACEAPRLRRALRLKGVGYGHRGASAALIDVDLTLPALSITALAGPSGAGKSTLADLIMGLTAPDAGEITIDDRRMDGPARIAWRRHVAYVPQDPYLFHDSLRANLLLARPDASDAELFAAIDRAGANFVLDWPAALQTIVGDRGQRLSGGERQRIALARALMTSPDLLVLDEATNALDANNEARVLQTLRSLAETMTILVIAHGGSVLSYADRVARMRGGRIVAVSALDASDESKLDWQADLR